MSEYYGAAFNLEQQIKTHLFVISPNNSGSTFLKNALATSHHTWNLKSEGQHVYGFVGPTPSLEGYPLLWAAKPERLSLLSNTSNYNWSSSKKAWYFQAYSKNPEATVFVEKSPTSLIRVDELQCNFHNSRFIFMVRNPYAVVEGIYRRFKRELGDDTLELAATHIINCFRYQRENIELYDNTSVFFNYEEMCADPKTIKQKIQALVPELDDLNLRQRISVKGIYDEMLRDMNGQQIERFSPENFDRINHVFSQNESLLNYFGYTLIEKTGENG